MSCPQQGSVPKKALVYQSELNFNSIVCNKTNFAIKTIEIEKIAPMKNDL